MTKYPYLYKVGGRRPAKEDEGWTIYSRYVAVDVEEDMFKQYLMNFKK